MTTTKKTGNNATKTTGKKGSKQAEPATITHEASAGIAPEAKQQDKADINKAIAEAKKKRDDARRAAMQEAAQNKAKAKADREKEAAEKRAAKAAEKEAKKNREPIWVEQKDENGGVEKVDKNKFPEQIECVDCGSIRHVTKSQLHEVVRCKYHAKLYKRRKIASKRKERMKGYREIVESALLLNLFPKEFCEKWGLECSK